MSNQRGNEEAREETEHEETNGGEEKEENKVVESEKEPTVRGDEEVKPRRSLKDGESQDVQLEDKETDKRETKTKKGEQKKSRKRRGKKQSEPVRNRRAGKDACKKKKEEEEQRGDTQEAPVTTSEENPALLEPSISLLSNCDLSDQVYLGFDGTEMYCPPAPLPYSSQPPVPIQPAPPQSHRTKRPRSPPQPHSLPLQTSQAEVRNTLLHLVALRQHKYIFIFPCVGK